MKKLYREAKNGFKNFLTKQALLMIVWLERDSAHVQYCRNEVPDWFEEEGPNRWMADNTVELLAVLSAQGHSGSSINFALKFFDSMARFDPWRPLTGEEREWMECGGGLSQNKRCSRVFRRPDGSAYDIEEATADGVTGITFPYTPRGRNNE